MEGRLTKKTLEYIKKFKDEIKEKALELNLEKSENNMKLFQFIYDYEPLTFTKEDFQKRKRVKNIVPIYDRCCAKKSSDVQCTRRRK